MIFIALAYLLILLGVIFTELFKFLPGGNFRNSGKLIRYEGAVEMVAFVLKNSCQKTFGFLAELAAVKVLSFYRTF
jgi:hypothetical protein